MISKEIDRSNNYQLLINILQIIIVLLILVYQVLINILQNFSLMLLSALNDSQWPAQKL